MFNYTDSMNLTVSLNDVIPEPMVMVIAFCDIEEDCMRPTDAEISTPHPPPSAVVTEFINDYLSESV